MEQGRKTEIKSLPDTVSPNLVGKRPDAQRVIQTKTSGLVVDGGWEPDGERLCSLLKEHGGHVTAWLLTHPHSDHVGVLYDILKNRVGELQITPNRPYLLFLLGSAVI